MTKEDVINFIAKMSVLELSEFVKELETKFGVSAAAAPVMFAPGAGASSEAAAPDEKTSFDVILLSAGDKKIQVIKEVKAITGLGLKEAKEVVDAAPKAIKEGLPQEEAEKIKAQLEEAGAQVEIK
ncbi:MAG: 50S ribosomal protein L7/L12 [Desulfobacterales bacterium]|nr:50S ribosomal protein L7/L12 [Desulfobacterales bacterium]